MRVRSGPVAVVDGHYFSERQVEGTLSEIIEKTLARDSMMLEIES